MGWQRARTPEQKAARKREILEAAAGLICTRTVEAVSLSAIARAVGLSKSNLYRYFSSREEVLLSLLTDDVEGLSVEAATVIEALPDTIDAEGLAEALVALVLRHDRLGRLLAQLTSVIERNVGEEALYTFKRSLLESLFAIAAQLERKWPDLLPPGGGADLIRYLIVLLEGLWPQKNPPEVLKRVMLRPELAAAHVSFEDGLVRGVTLVIRGLQAEARELRA